ncbi:GyrI-like domain-containing protein [Solicola sp. PLA-1-18]|uniref:GyrI-like domain-containing protein n=1 Tax=Solicola sp. PLA-1-18 TaxID=3380532 RepID=UPI003B798851
MEPKVDHKRAIGAYRARQGVLDVVEVPDLQYLMIDGHGDPNTGAFTEAVGALFPVAYTLKFAGKRDLGRDHVVMPLEGLWWADDLDAFTSARDKARWDWTLMVMVPDWVGPEMFDAAVEQVARRRDPSRLGDVRLAPLSEGLCVQTLHVGSFDDEGPVLERLHHEFVPAHGLRPTGRHHEVYLSDVRRTAPDRLRTILRQPVIRTGTP